MVPVPELRSSLEFASNHGLTMPILSCPACGVPTPRLVKAPSHLANVNYYRCSACGHVWTVAKNNPDVLTHVTPLPQQPKKH
jgi:rubredoxin